MSKVLMPSDRKIVASPTKDFFISMLVKDISLIRAILDLVDNSIDGARRTQRSTYDGLWIRIEATPDHFKVADNCGGMSIAIARNYAFRFGRPSGMEATPHSIGQFGVGMKRAFFKLGKEIMVESITSTSRFVVSVNVDLWKATDEWEFEFSELDENQHYSTDRCGTSISIKSLHDSVSKEFELGNFQNRLRGEIEVAYTSIMSQGVAISLNGVPVKMHPTELLQSDSLNPAYRSLELEVGGEKLTVKIYAGIAESSPSTAGWYIFCNGRLVLGPDQAITTGWGETGEAVIPKYHNQYARFKGYVFFDSDNASLLPWNTTKTGVDADAPTYKRVRLEMINMMRPVIDFLNRLDSEKDKDENLLEEAVSQATKVELSDVRGFNIFKSPNVAEMTRFVPKVRRIQYDKPIEEIDRVKRCLRVTSLREIGEKTFQYYLEMECGD